MPGVLNIFQATDTLVNILFKSMLHINVALLMCS